MDTEVTYLILPNGQIRPVHQLIKLFVIHFAVFVD